MSFPHLLRILFFAVVTGFGWLAYGHVYSWGIPFWASGLLTGVWFLPAIFAASVQAHADLQRPGWIFLAEATASVVSATLGPMGWVSFQFGLAQGLLGEIGFRFRPTALSTALAAGFADLSLLALHPAGFAASESTGNWVAHAAGVLFSAALLARVVDAGIQYTGRRS